MTSLCPSIPANALPLSPPPNAPQIRSSSIPTPVKTVSTPEEGPRRRAKPDQTRPTCRHQADEAECMRLPTRQSGSMDPPRARSRDSLLRIASPNVAKPQLCSHPGRYPPQEERKGSSVTCNASRFFERGKTETRQLARPLSRRLNSRVKLPPPPPPPPSVSVDRFARGR